MNISNITKKRILKEDPPLTAASNVTQVSPPVIINKEAMEVSSLIDSHKAVLSSIANIKSAVQSAELNSVRSVTSSSTPVTASQLDSLFVSNPMAWASASSQYESSAWDQGTSMGAMMYSALQGVEADLSQSLGILGNTEMTVGAMAITPEMRALFNRRVSYAGTFISRIVTGALTDMWNEAGSCFLNRMAILIDGLASGVNALEIQAIIKAVSSQPNLSGAGTTGLQVLAGALGGMDAPAIGAAIATMGGVIKASSVGKKSEWKSIGDDLKAQIISTISNDALAILNNTAGNLYYKINSPLISIGAVLYKSNILGECPLFDDIVSNVTESVSELERNLIYNLYSWEILMERKYDTLSSLSNATSQRINAMSQASLLTEIAMIVPELEISKGVGSILSSLSSRGI